MENLLRSEIIKSQAISSTAAGIGEYVFHNNENCIQILPNKFYANSAYISIIPSELFKENTSYILDLWIDRSALSDTSSKGGIQIDYIDGTTDTSLDKRPDTTVDFEHHIIITPSNKTISKINNIYHSNRMIYLRWDSSICEVDQFNILNNGQIKTTQLKENINPQASIYKGGHLVNNNFYEY